MGDVTPEMGPPQPEGHAECGYSDSRGFEQLCGRPATRHILWDGDNCSAACEQHWPVASSRWPIYDWHRFEGMCNMPGAFWVFSWEQPPGCCAWRVDGDTLAAAEAAERELAASHVRCCHGNSDTHSSGVPSSSVHVSRITGVGSPHPTTGSRRKCAPGPKRFHRSGPSQRVGGTTQSSTTSFAAAWPTLVSRKLAGPCDFGVKDLSLSPGSGRSSHRGCGSGPRLARRRVKTLNTNVEMRARALMPIATHIPTAGNLPAARLAGRAVHRLDAGGQMSDA